MIYRPIILSAALVLLSACQGGGQPDERAGQGRSAPAGPSRASPGGGDTPAAAPIRKAPPAPTPKSAPPSASASTPALTAYVGKYPFEKVSGVAWVDHPVVQAVIRRSVTDPGVRKAILGTAGTADPIVSENGRLRSWMCEPHNCGGHRWTVVIDPGTATGDVCYYDASVSDDNARWFLASGKAEMRRGNCSGQ